MFANVMLVHWVPVDCFLDPLVTMDCCGTLLRIDLQYTLVSIGSLLDASIDVFLHRGASNSFLGALVSPDSVFGIDASIETHGTLVSGGSALGIDLTSDFLLGQLMLAGIDVSRVSLVDSVLVLDSIVGDFFCS